MNKTPFGKNFTRTDFFNAVTAMCEGQEMDGETVVKMISASQYEIGKIEGAASRAAERKEAGTAKNILDGDYAQGLIRDVVALAQPGTQFTAAELCKMATDKQIVSHTGKPYSIMWIGRVMKELVSQGRGYIEVTKMVDTTNGVGEPMKREIKAYQHVQGA